MKVITVKQPWASLMFIDNGYKPKNIENRTWKTNVRGRILIHAGASVLSGDNLFTDEQYDQIHGDIMYKMMKGKLPTSAIIGSVEIVDCVVNHPSIWAEQTFFPIDDSEGHPPHQIIYNWVLENPILFDTPIPAKGKLSFWNYEL